jgi:hypothetical protein
MLGVRGAAAKKGKKAATANREDLFWARLDQR